MKQEQYVGTIEKILLVGIPLISIFVLISSVTDPVNTPKLFVTGGIAFALVSLVAIFGVRFLWNFEKPALILSLLFIMACFNAVINTKAPFNQKFYGVYGRNTGFLAYFFLTLIFISTLLIRNKIFFKKLLYSLLFAGVINLIYCAWVLAFGDFLGWNNPYGTILGLLGNPNFISSFLGMTATLLFAIFASPERNIKVKIGTILLILLALYEIRQSRSIQGFFVSALGFAIVLYFYLRSRFNGRAVPLIYLLISSLVGFMAIMGTLQKGPLDFLYKRSVSFRGSYWRTGIKMGSEHPFTGVGMDSYGDWYRRDRPDIALVDTPDIKTLTNAAHNVFIDFFANGGYPLMISYVSILILTLISIFKVVRLNRNFDWIFVGMSAVWIGYIVQSIISINQIGLAVWGWVLSGSIISYSRILSSENKKEVENKETRNKSKSIFVSPQLVAGLGLVIGLIIAVPPLNADMKWRRALGTQNAAEADKALISSYMNPLDSYRLADAVDSFMRSNLNDLALKYSKIAIDYNPDFFTAWLMYYYLPNIDTQQKEIAYQNLKRLDPKNPNVLSTD